MMLPTWSLKVGPRELDGVRGLQHPLTLFQLEVEYINSEAQRNLRIISPTPTVISRSPP